MDVTLQTGLPATVMSSLGRRKVGGALGSRCLSEEMEWLAAR